MKNKALLIKKTYDTLASNFTEARQWVSDKIAP
jgi:hypothetical protein